MKLAWNSPNVTRAKTYIYQALWDYIFPHAHSRYEFDDFLRAMAHFPSFCGTDGDSTSVSDEELCARELGTLFAHITYETNCNDPTLPDPSNRQGLCFLEEQDCDTEAERGINDCWYDGTNFSAMSAYPPASD